MKKYIVTAWGWEEAFQKDYVANHFNIAHTHIIERHEAVGMVKYQNKVDALHLETIEIAPSVQNEGIGTSILKTMVAKAASQHKPVKLQVLKVNPAKKLYERFNFEVVHETATHFVMQKG